MDLENYDTDADYVPDKDELQPENNSARRCSVMWGHFKRVENFGAICNYCDKTLSYRTSVTNLKKHLNYRHPGVLDSTSVEKKHTGLSNQIQKDKTRREQQLSRPRNQLMRKRVWKYVEVEDSSNHSRTTVTLVRKSSKSPQAPAKRSEIWKYFKVSPEDPRRASCNMCDQVVASTHMSNLNYHLMKQHSKIDVDKVASSDEEEQGKNQALKSMKKRKRSEGWKYFEIKDREHRIANCKVCRRDISYCTVSNLMKHIIRKHGKTEFNTTAGSDNEEVDLSKRESRTYVHKPQKQFRSTTWKYFTVLDDVNKVANCKLCKRDFAYTTVSNLRKHLLRKHQDVLALADPSTDDEGEPEAEEVADIDTSSPIWAYFRCLDQTLRIASCLVCKKRINYSNESDLKRHLSRKHPQVDYEGLRDKTKKLMITGNGDIFEVDDDVAKQEPDTNQEDNDNDSSDDWPKHNAEIDALHSTEYLDENAFDEIEYTPPKKRLKRPSYKRETEQGENSLDIFGKYMVSLLKKLPKHKSDQLQVDFVRQIMETQNDDRNNSYKSQVQKTRYVSNDDTRVSSNSEVQRVIATDGKIHLGTGNEQIIVTSIGDEITISR